MKKTLLKSAQFLFLIIFALNFSFGEQATDFFPEIEELKSSNHLFAQYQQDVQESNRQIFRGIKPEIQFYSYTAKKGDTTISIAARCSIRQDTFATANGIQESSQAIEGKKLLLPVCDGLFIPQKPENSFELLLAGEYSSLSGGTNSEELLLYGRIFYFLPQEKFSPSQRAYFLNPGMCMPLEKSVLTSAYGMRISPISGKWKMHRGIDLASPKGSRILACREGTVKTAVKNHPVYGNYIIIRHPNGMESLYAHMDTISVEKNAKVATGQRIGTVGMTGQTTGPHLHFEISQNGSSLNPENYLKNQDRN